MTNRNSCFSCQVDESGGGYVDTFFFYMFLCETSGPSGPRQKLFLIFLEVFSAICCSVPPLNVDGGICAIMARNLVLMLSQNAFIPIYVSTVCWIKKLMFYFMIRLVKKTHTIHCEFTKLSLLPSSTATGRVIFVLTSLTVLTSNPLRPIHCLRLGNYNVGLNE